MADYSGASYEFDDEAATRSFGQSLASCFTERLLITLKGDLGTGKTTLARGILEGLGYKGKVKSPTYTIVEPYELSVGMIYHFDLYRIVDPGELEFLGFRDYLSDGYLTIVEWPERGDWFLHSADLCISIETIAFGRRVFMRPNTRGGALIFNNLQAFLKVV